MENTAITENNETMESDANNNTAVSGDRDAHAGKRGDIGKSVNAGEKEKKTISLNRTLRILVFVGFGAALLLLCCLDITSISNYQITRKTEWDTLLYEQQTRMKQNLEEIYADISSIYVTDSDFDTLKKGDDAVAVYTSATELNKRLYNEMSEQEQLNGYLIMYSDNYEGFQNFYEPDVMEYADVAEIHSEMLSMLPVHANGHFWTYMYINGKTFAVCVAKKGKAAVCMVSRLDLELQESDGGYEGQEAFLVYSEDAKEDGCLKYLGDENDQQNHEPLLHELQGKIKDGSYSGSWQGRQVFLRSIVSSSLWLGYTVKMNLWSYMTAFQLCLLIITALAITVSIYVYFKLKKELILPLNTLVAEMNAIRDGQISHEIETESRFSELNLVSVTMDQMIRELEEQKNIAYEQTIEKQKAQMQYLSMQLKPHFYLNGLKTLNVMALNGERQKMQDLILRLSYHMRYILQLEKEMVLLQDEINYVNNYADLQRDMTDRPLAIVWSVSEELMQWRVPTLCIQTFVENSFKYAKVGNIKSQLTINISIDELETEDGKFLDINIQDNGNGYPERTLEVINGDPVESSISVGINNLKRRCRILYGNWAEYDFYNDGGAVSELILPWTQEGRK